MRMLRPHTLFLLGLASLAACGPEGGGPGEGADQPTGTAQEASTTVCPTTTVEGLDVSAGQGTIDWGQVKSSGRQFAIIKATQGNYYTSSEFAAQWSGAKAAGLMVSPYHFFDPTVDGTAQAQYFLNVVGTLGPGDLPPMLDIECPTSSNQSQTQPDCEYGGSSPDSGWAPGGTITQRIQDWLTYVQQQTGRTPLIYSYNYWFSDSGVNDMPLLSYPLVISWPTTGNCYEVGLGNDFTSAAFWQWSVTGSCPGVSGTVDLDRYNGTLAGLQALAGYGSLSQISGNDAMTLVNWTNDGHPEIFVKTKAGEMLHTYPNATSDTWNMMYTLDMSSECGAAAGFWPIQGYAELFDPAPDGTAQHLWLDLMTGWTKWNADLGGMPSTKLSHMSTLVWQDGHMEVFALGADGAIWHTHMAQGIDPGWAPWASLGGTDLVTGAAGILWNDGHAEVFATDSKGAAWHTWSGSGASFPGGWHAFASLGGDLASRPVPVRWADGHLEIFATGNDGQLYHAAYGTSWGTFSALSPGSHIAGEPSAIVNPMGNGASAGPEVFARATDGTVVHLWWNGTSWTSFTPHFTQSTSSDPFAWIRSDGSAEVFTIDDTGVLTRSYHDPKNGWQAWSAIGGMDLDPCVPMTPPPPVDGGIGGSSSTSGPSTSSGKSASTSSSAGAGGGNAKVPNQKSGCSCRVAGAPEGASGAAALALVGLLVVRRRRAAGHARS